MVFDALAHAPSVPSLNDIAFPGPNLNSYLFDLILKFRYNNIALVADIEKIATFSWRECLLQERAKNKFPNESRLSNYIKNIHKNFQS
ncbi:hypothetical protein CDAR_376451 [Caerostris darwini]|uniref:Uncharacterized protein n=1 Tax=Caerostris darwini TaxID=1538125 RepID=A0AAV4PDE7_9ARAC|nr:hypothetical protein CDAR_376451 [Caerostris darwini]